VGRVEEEGDRLGEGDRGGSHVLFIWGLAGILCDVGLISARKSGGWEVVVAG
jgi:hypothetical protein